MQQKSRSPGTLTVCLQRPEILLPLLILGVLRNILSTQKLPHLLLHPSPPEWKARTLHPVRKPRTRLHDCLQTTETRETYVPTGWAAPARGACTVELQGQFLHKVCVVLQPPREVLTGITPSAISDGALPHGGAAIAVPASVID